MSPTELKRSRVQLHADHVSNVSSMDFPGTVTTGDGDDDLSWSLDRFKQSFDINITSLDPMTLTFDMINVDASIANAFRRIMISEIPTLAIERVYVAENTGVMQDEVLAHRLGLIPIRADARLFEYFDPASQTATDLNTVVLNIDARCERNPAAPDDTVDPYQKYTHFAVTSADMTWVPQGFQAEAFAVNPIEPVTRDILITKLRPGQAVKCELHCQKGIGKSHAKWSPVATASYRLLPEITLLQPIVGAAETEAFRKCFPEGVIGVAKNADGEPEAYVKNPRLDTMSREVLRHPQFADKVRLTRVRNHFLYTVESTGIYDPHVIVAQAADVLIEKCKAMRKALVEVTQLGVEV
ncbi:hypothetical protein CXG81DRAFT_13100 [Caulochytrium protostelioides]|uniref:DNA-directed RNA polymerases I and III subunit RPAC1 n=1 Tax=Caulochytrium protostelioides TaxID=1555241 RepID=A0A4P9X5X3_9FUNG|nr:hypothetical protein CXG81DRAFT_13100 [Caulochytrium protostelioides]|eukprot:RKP00553.1 hypothetical protein CXG81DRAFT_13100 [Caulochytrium protostelioides]